MIENLKVKDLVNILDLKLSIKLYINEKDYIKDIKYVYQLLDNNNNYMNKKVKSMVYYGCGFGLNILLED